MEYAAQRLCQCCLCIIDFRGDFYGIYCRDCYVFCQAAGQAGDAVLAVERALMRITGRAVFAHSVAAGAQAVQALVQDNPVAGVQASSLITRILDNANDLMAEDLRLGGKGNQSSSLVSVVVRMTGEDVEVGSAQANSLDSYKHIGWPEARKRYIEQFHPANACQDACPHCCRS
jgi:hypothetical protein